MSPVCVIAASTGLPSGPTASWLTGSFTATASHPSWSNDSVTFEPETSVTSPSSATRSPSFCTAPPSRPIRSPGRARIVPWFTTEAGA